MCEKKHNIGESIEAGSPVAVVVSDQNFPPVLPTEDGNCVVVIRVEDGRLFEIENVFKDIFKKTLGSCGQAPRGQHGARRLARPPRSLRTGELHC